MPLRVLLVMLLAAASVAADPRPVSREVIEDRLARAQRGNAERHEELVRLFESAGCTGRRLSAQPVPDYDLPNVLCTIPGHTSRVILITAHYDMTGPGLGVADNWASTSLLPSLYQSFARTKPRHTLVFIGFSEEEKGLLGAKHYLREALEAGSLRDIAAMINLDGAGMAATRVWQTKSDPTLVRRLKALAKELGVIVIESSFDGAGIMDSFPFHQRGVRVLSLHGLATGNLHVPHSRHDDFGAVDPRHLYDTYRLVTRMLEDLDAESLTPRSGRSR